MLSTVLTYFVFQVNVFSETTPSFLLSLSVSVALYMWRAMRENCHFFHPWNRNSLQIAKFNVSFIICHNVSTFLISFEISSFKTYFSNIVSIVVVIIKITFCKSAFLSGLNCFLRTSFFCFTNFEVVPLKFFVYFSIKSYFFPMIKWLFCALVLFSSFSLPAKIAIKNH